MTRDELLARAGIRKTEHFGYVQSVGVGGSRRIPHDRSWEDLIDVALELINNQAARKVGTNELLGV